MLLRQCHASFWGNLCEDLHLSQIVLAALALYLIYSDFVLGQMATFSWIWKIGPHAGIFYAVRELVDWHLEITWHPKYHYML